MVSLCMSERDFDHLFQKETLIPLCYLGGIKTNIGIEQDLNKGVIKFLVDEEGMKLITGSFTHFDTYLLKI